MMMTDARKARPIFAHIDPRQKISSIKIEDPVGARPLPGHLPPPRGVQASRAGPYRSIRILILEPSNPTVHTSPFISRTEPEKRRNSNRFGRQWQLEGTHGTDSRREKAGL